MFKNLNILNFKNVKVLIFSEKLYEIKCCADQRIILVETKFNKFLHKCN